MVSERTVLPTIIVNLSIELGYRLGLVPLFVGAGHCNGLFDCLNWDERDPLACISGI